MADSLIIRIDGDASAYQKELNKVKDGVAEVNKIAKTVAVGVASVGAAVVGIGVNFNAEMEQYRAGLTTLLGSAEQAEDTLAELKDFAAKTPFELTDLAQASNVLLAFGEDSKNLMDDIKMLGDISLGNKEKFQGLALVFGQVQSQGRLLGQDLLQMVNNGFNPLQIISEKTGESMASLKDKMSDGKISFEMVAEAMKIATAEGGRYYNAMETQSKTLTGQMSTLKDNVNALFGEMTESLSKSLAEDVLPWLIEQVEELNKAWEEGRLQEYIKIATIALAMFGTAVVSLNLVMFANDIYSMAKGVKDYTAATKLGTTAQKLFNLELIKNPYVLAAMALTTLIAGIITYAATHTSVSEEIQKSLEDLKKSHEDAIKSIDQTASAEMAEAESALLLKDKLFTLEEQIKSGTLTQEEAEQAQRDFNTAAAKLEEIIPGITDYLYDETGEINIQKQAVDELAASYYDLAIAKSMANAYQQKMDETAKALADARDAQKKAQAHYKNQSAYYQPDTNGDGVSTWDEWRWGGFGNQKVQSAYSDLVDTNKAVADLEAEFEGYFKEMSSYTEEVKKLVGDVGKTVDKTDDENTKTVTSGNAKRTKDTKTALETDINNLQKAHKYGMISDKEYYLELAKLRNKYFEEGSDDWEDYTDEIFDYYNDMLSDAKENALSQLEEISDAQKSLANKLHESSNLTYEQYSIVEKGEETTYTRLADVGASNRKLEQYNNLLDRVYEKRPDLPDNFTNFLADMDVDEAISYLTELLTASEANFNKYMDDLVINQQLSDEVSSKVYSSEFKEFAESLEAEFGQLPEDFFEIGEESAEQYGKGFMSQLKSVFEEVKATISAEVQSLSSQLAIAGAGNVTTNTYTDARTTNIYASSASPREIIEEQKANETYQQHTSKWGE